MPRLLIINPNTTAAMTAKVGNAARAFLPGVEIVEATGRFGCDYIASRSSYAIASHAALDCFAEYQAGCDAVLLACFGDPGLEALREISSVPVIGLIDATTEEAGLGGRRFAIVTGGARWGPMLDEMIRLRGLGSQLAAIRTVAPTGGDIARDPEGSLGILRDVCRACIEDDEAEAIILGGAGLLGLAARLQPNLRIPVICSIEAGLRAAKWALQEPGHQHAPAEPGAARPSGLSPHLLRLLSGPSPMLER